MFLYCCCFSLWLLWLLLLDVSTVPLFSSSGAWQFFVTSPLYTLLEKIAEKFWYNRLRKFMRTEYMLIYIIQIIVFTFQEVTSFLFVESFWKRSVLLSLIDYLFWVTCTEEGSTDYHHIGSDLNYKANWYRYQLLFISHFNT